MVQIDMFIKRTKDEKVSLVNVYSLKNNIKFDEDKLFGAYKESMKEIIICEINSLSSKSFDSSI